MTTPKASPNQKKSQSPISIGHTRILIWIVFFSFLFIYHYSFYPSLLEFFQFNVLETIWNFMLAWMGTKAILRVWFYPLWLLIFPNNKQLGQKLEWYDKTYQHLTPNTIRLAQLRFSIVIIISLILLSIPIFSSTFLNKYLVSYALFFEKGANTQYLLTFFSSWPWFFLEYFSILSLYIFWGLKLEGRSRIIARLYLRRELTKTLNAWKMPMPKIPWDAKDDEISLCISTEFLDDKENESLNQSSYERWIKQTEKGLKANTLVISPTGGGKTISVVKPAIEQFIFWQANNPIKKASGAIYDPKAELTELAVEIAKKAGRENDLLVLSLDAENSINPIKVNNIWEGQNAYRVSSWIINAWQNFQGASSPEPYWRSQLYLLVRHLLVLHYLYDGENTNLYNLSKTIAKSTKGCFDQSIKLKSVKQEVNEFGRWLLIAYASVNLEQPKTLSEIDSLSYKPLPPNLITREVTELAEKNNKIKIGRFIQERKQYHLSTNEKIVEINETINSIKNEDVRKDFEPQLEAEKSKLSRIIKKEVEDKFGKGKPNDEEYTKSYIEIEAKKLRKVYENLYQDPDTFEQVRLLVTDASEAMLNGWSNNNSDNRGSIVSNIAPFLTQFETPEMRKVFSPERENVDFDKVVNSGTIFIPNFPGVKIGDGLANAIISLCKSRWQYAVLGQPENKRIKFQLKDEAQRIISLGSKDIEGDFEYMELSRSYGGITVMLSQSISALKARAGRSIDWDKVHGVIRSIYCMSTNDSETIEFMQKIAGKEVKKRISRTVTEHANTPKLESISEKYTGENDSLSIAYTESESLEEVIQSKDIQLAEAYTGIAIIYDGYKNSIKKFSLRPHFWPYRRDKWELIRKSEFSPLNRKKYTNNKPTDQFQKLAA